MAVCQPSVPVMAAVSLMSAESDPAVPASMTLMGGPIDTRINPTQVNALATAKPLEWFAISVVETVPARYPGAFRRVYPGFLQLAGFMTMNLDRHVTAHFDLFKHLVRGDGESADQTRRFYDEYLSVMDLRPTSISTRSSASSRSTRCRSAASNCAAARSTRRRSRRPRSSPSRARRTISARSARPSPRTISAPTSRTGKKAHHLQPRVGHYGVFNGRRWREEIYPKVRDFIAANG